MLIKFCKACTKAKQQQRPSYIPQLVSKDILNVIYLDVVGSITLTNFNNYYYYLIFIDGYSRLQWVKSMKKKCEAFS